MNLLENNHCFLVMKERKYCGKIMWPQGEREKKVKGKLRYYKRWLGRTEKTMAFNVSSPRIYHYPSNIYTCYYTTTDIQLSIYPEQTALLKNVFY